MLCLYAKVNQSPIFYLQLLGLYKGLASPLYGLAAINAIVFGVQGHVQRRFNNPDHISSHFLAGATAGAVQCVICSPMELAKTRLQVQGQGESNMYFKTHTHMYSGPVDCLVKIYRTEGIRGVFRGIELTLIRETPSFGVYFAAYEIFCRLLDSKDGDGVLLSTPYLLLAGGCAGMCSWTSTYPADVMKSRMQADMHGKYKGLKDCVVKSYQELGLQVFTRGLGSTLLRAFPVNAATFATVTLTLRYLRADREDDGYYDASVYAAQNHPPNAPSHLPLVPNFPSHP